MTTPATLMEYGWSFLDARMSNPADYEMVIGSDSVESGLVKDHPESNYSIVHDSFAKVVAMLRGTCTLRSVLLDQPDALGRFFRRHRDRDVLENLEPLIRHTT